MIWSPQQDAALVAARDWLRGGSDQIFRMFGYAGTGKTTLAVHLAQDEDALFAAFTGKAALVMRKKGCRGAQTLHSLIYTSVGEAGHPPEFVVNHDSDLRRADLLIIDEVSMVDEELARDVLSFGTRVLVLGDPAQLPPVRGTGYFVEAVPDVMLTEVHRQAADNPIIAFATLVREGHTSGRWQSFDDRCRVVARDDLVGAEVTSCDQILVGRNRTRAAHNARNRDLLGYPRGTPVVGDKLVCLRNDRTKGLLNGGLWRVVDVGGNTTKYVGLVVRPDDREDSLYDVRVVVDKRYFYGREAEMSPLDIRTTDHFTFGYALTVHKAQGSEWGNVFLFDESSAFREDARRWLYTGVTRAADRLTVVLP